MKKIVLSILMFIPLGIIAQEMKIAVVNTSTVFNALPELSAAESELAKTMKQYQNEYKLLMDEYNKKQADLISQGDSLPDNIKMHRLQEIKDIEARVENYVPVADEAIAKEKERLLTPLRTKIDKAIKEVGTENGYTYIFIDDPQIVLFKGPSAIDATDKVKAKLGIK